MKLNELTIASAQKMMEAGEITSLAVTKACLEAIKRRNKRLNACLTIDEKAALSFAQDVDRRRAKGEKGALLGIPFLAKDNIMTKGMRTTAASKMLGTYIAPYDATVIAKLKKAGAVLLGKTNLDEFAHGASTEYSAFGVTKNPYDLARVAGGSSGGSAAALAADFCLFALGTDTGGSVRHPASFCGVVGTKPTYGLCSRFGLISMTSSTDVPGCLTKTAGDAALVVAAMAGHDNRDATSLEQHVRIDSKKLTSFKGMTFGVPKEVDGLSLPVRRSFDRMKEEIKKLGGKIIPISLPSSKFALAAYYVITPSEVSSNLARFDGIRFGTPSKKAKNLAAAYEEVREHGFGPEVKRRIMLGTYCLSAGYYDAYYVRAQKVRTKVSADLAKAFERCDFIMTPTTPTPAFVIGKNNNPLKMYLEDIFLVPASLAGVPAVSIPALKKPLPIGLQFIGPALSEERLFATASLCETITVDQSVRPTL